MSRTFEEAVELGIYTPAEVDDDGQILYSCDLQKAKELAPDIYYAEIRSIDEAVLAAVEAGYLRLDFGIDPEGNPYTDYTVTDKKFEDE